jgi:hypothetical protein
MKKTLALTICLLLAANVSLAEEKKEVKSGLQPGESPPAYNVLDATGPSEGKKLCYRCQYGPKPVVNIFTRELNESVAALVKGIDGQVAQNSEKKMCAFVVLLTDKPEEDTKALKEFAKKHGIKNTPLTTYENTQGPGNYKIAKDAAVTVMMWNKQRVRVNHAFADAKLPEESVKSVVSDTKNILN